MWRASPRSRGDDTDGTRMTPGFWRIIEETRPPDGGPSAHAEAITAALVSAGAEETRRFAGWFDEAIDALYTWPLWGAGYLAMSGCSDDAFEYLRAWIIGSGEATWELARSDPERLFVDLLDGGGDPDARWEQLGINEGESLLYAGGAAHERLTGEWLPARSRPHPGEPAGAAWEEDDLPEMFPDLASALPDDWRGFHSVDGLGSGDSADYLRVMIQVEQGVAAFSAGEHLEAARQLDEIVNDPEHWKLVAADRTVDVAYIVGIGRLLAGDVEGASAALLRVEAELGDADHVRRALAQVEMARGDLESAGRWIDDSEDAARSDRVLAAKLAWRRGDREEAVRRAAAEIEGPLRPEEHVWDVAGSIQQLGRIFADAGNTERADRAVETVTSLLADAPDDLPLRSHLRLLRASVVRLQGRPQEALELLEGMRGDHSGTDLAECLRERARSQLALGLHDDAGASYDASIAEFERAGERWETRATREESRI